MLAMLNKQEFASRMKRRHRDSILNSDSQPGIICQVRRSGDYACVRRTQGARPHRPQYSTMNSLARSVCRPFKIRLWCPLVARGLRSPRSDRHGGSRRLWLSLTQLTIDELRKILYLYGARLTTRSSHPRHSKHRCVKIEWENSRPTQTAETIKIPHKIVINKLIVSCVGG
jgi:hypothetical protein